MKTKLFLLWILFFPILNAQVGVNTETPNQMLSVNGKVEIGDDSVTATEGTMRYNAEDADFQGFANGQWHSFTNRANLPKNAKPVFGYIQACSPGELEDFTLYYEETNAFAATQIPAGKFLIVTEFTFNPNSLTTNLDAINYLTIGPRVYGIEYPDYRRRSLFVVQWKTPQRHISGMSPAFIVRPGEYFSISNESTSTHTLDARMRGFLVDDLNFN